MSRGGRLLAFEWILWYCRGGNLLNVLSLHALPVKPLLGLGRGLTGALPGFFSESKTTISQVARSIHRHSPYLTHLTHSGCDDGWENWVISCLYTLRASAATAFEARQCEAASAKILLHPSLDSIITCATASSLSPRRHSSICIGTQYGGEGEGDPRY